MLINKESLKLSPIGMIILGMLGINLFHLDKFSATPKITIIILFSDPLPE